MTEAMTQLPPLDGKWWRILATTPVRVHTLKGSIRLRPGAIVNDCVSSPVNAPGVVEPADLPALVRSPDVKHLGILRPGELGDVIVALTACRFLRRALPNLECVSLHCMGQFHPVVMQQNEVRIEECHLPLQKLNFLAVDFTMYFEQDHKPEAAHIPRLDRVLRTFGFEPPYC